MTEATEILILGELDNGSLTSTSKELLAAGRSLANTLGQKLSLGVLGTDLEQPAQDAIPHGADKVYLVSNPLLAHYQVELHLAALTQLCRQVSPNIILIGRTNNGRDLAPRLAVRLDAGMAQDCLTVEIDPQSGRMVARRPVYGGNATAAVSCVGTPQIACVRPKAYEPLDPDSSRHGEFTPVEVNLDSSMARVRVVEKLKEETEGVSMENARIVIAGGRGLGGPDPFQDLEVIAKLLGAAVGASRAVVDSGWVPPHLQIGLTGKTITPDLYITVGISGASQHMAGCSGAKIIVAINKDAEANIFKEARYGVVGDWQKVLPAFTEALRELVG